MMVTVLSGIKTAAVNGERIPCTAKKTPIRLYEAAIIKLRFIVVTAFLD